MIPRAFRLPMGKNAPHNGETHALAISPFLLVKYRPNGLSHHRFGVIVGAKAGKTAVLRHRIKRTVLVSLMAWPPQRARICYDFLVIASTRLSSLPSREVGSAVRESCSIIQQQIF